MELGTGRLATYFSLIDFFGLNFYLEQFLVFSGNRFIFKREANILFKI